jgi:hypothetical protein
VHQAPQATLHPIRVLIRVFALAVIIVVDLFLLNNTSVGLSIKCRVLGDSGACLVVELIQPQENPVQQILQNIGNSV